ncbi:MAG: hypothetical protein KC561_17145, partial [Myxococcales bacterium]|nr:hypothetical protein [Myxococcales bacterium]
MREPNLVHIFTGPLNQLEIRYAVTGSVAGIMYGEPRLTHDVDLIVDLESHAVDSFLSRFPEVDFYRPPTEVVRTELARETRGHFNLIHH